MGLIKSNLIDKNASKQMEEKFKIMKISIYTLNKACYNYFIN